MRQPRNTTGVSPDAAAPSAPIASDGADGFSQTDALDCVMRFGALLLRAGDTAFRVRQRMGNLARAMGIEALAVHVTLGGMTATARRGVARTTLATEIAPLGINAWRIAALEELASTVQSGVSAAALTARLDAIEAEPALHTVATIAVAVGMASGGFSYLNGGGPQEVVASLIAGCIGQALRSLMFRHRLNQYAVTTVCAVIASGVYCLIAAALSAAGFAIPQHAAGFISSALFLVPGFPLVAAVLDLLQHQTTAGVARLAYAVLVLAAAALGLSLVASAADLTALPPPPMPLGEAATLLLRALASAVGACCFALLYNSRWRTACIVGGLALVGNELRLALYDAGVALAPATLVGALTVGLLAPLVRLRLREPRISLTVPATIMMIPGTYTFQTVVLLSRGDMLAGLRALAAASFVVGAIAVGLAAARALTESGWLVES